MLRPPECAVCGVEFFDDEGGLIYFRKRDSDVAWEKKMKKNGMVGHPPYAEWFCGEHIKIAKKYRHLIITEAMHEIAKESAK